MAGANSANTGHIDSSGPTTPITERWSFSINWAHQLTSPVVADGVLYFGASDFDETDDNKNDAVYAVDAWTGEKAWSFTMDEASGPNTPAVFKNTVYVTTHKGKMYALDTKTGEVFWKFKPGKPAKPPTVANRTVYVSGDGTLYALDALTGKERWAYAPNSGPSSVAVVDSTVYFGGNNEVYAMDAQDGTLRWKSTTGDGGHAGTPSVANGVVYVGTFHGTVYAFEANTGDKLWKQAYRGSGGIPGSPSLVGDTAYIGTRSRFTVVSVEAKTGRERWSTRLQGRTSPPAVVNGTAYSAHDRFVSLLNTDTGNVITRFSLNNQSSQTISSPAVVNGSLYIGYGMDDGPGSGYKTTRMYALGTPEFTYEDISVSSRSIEANESVNLTATVKNTGTGPGEFNATLTVDGKEFATRTGRLDVASRTTVTFTLNFQANGTYTVSVADIERTIAVGDISPTPTPTLIENTGSDATPSPTGTSDTSQTPTNTPNPAPTPGFDVFMWLISFVWAVGLLGLRRLRDHLKAKG